MSGSRSLPLALALLFAAANIWAHDFWIEPSTYRPKVGQTFTAGLRVGENFAGDPVPRRTPRIEAFVVRTRSEERPVEGVENQDPAGHLRLDRPGLAIIGYRSKPTPHKLTAEKFEAYLREEGLDRVRELRRELGHSTTPGSERFYRYAKALVVTGEGLASGADQALGYRYELIPETDPYASTPLVVRAVLEGKPVAGALIVAIPKDNPALRRSARSDRSGRVTFELPRGVWLIKSVQMVPATGGANADWDSLWASLTFER